MPVLSRARYVILGIICLTYVLFVLALHLSLHQFDVHSQNSQNDVLKSPSASHLRRSNKKNARIPRRDTKDPHSSARGSRGSVNGLHDFLRWHEQSGGQRLYLNFPAASACKDHSSESSKPEKAAEFQALGVDYLYTAFYDDRLPGYAYVRVIALLRRRSKAESMPTFYFRFARAAVGSSGVDRLWRAELYEMCENHGRRYGGWILSAQLDANLSSPPCEVLVSQDAVGANYSSRVEVRLNVYRLTDNDPVRVDSNDVHSPAKLDFAVCVPPLFGALTAATLVQFVELTRLLGAQHFVFYVGRVSGKVQKVLARYSALGLATQVDWNLPVTRDFVWYNGQLLAVNDCLYRTMHAFHHVAFNDVDEFIVPHQTANWSAMIADLWSSDGLWKNRREAASTWTKWLALLRRLLPFTGNDDHVLAERESTVCGYSFQSAFFEPTTSSNASVTEAGYDLTSVRRSAFSRVRNKVMVRPETIFELGIHHVSRPLYSLEAASGLQGPSDVIPVPPNAAFLHHYRECIREFDLQMDCSPESFIHDDRLLTAGYIPILRRLIRRTLQIVTHL